MNTPRASASSWSSLGLLAIVLGALAVPLQAATYYWDTNGPVAGAGGPTPSSGWFSPGASWNFSPAGNSFTPAVITSGSDSLVFSAGTDATGSYTVSVSGTQAAHDLSIEDGAVTFSGGTISLTGGGVTLGSSAGDATINSALSLLGNQTFQVVGSRVLTVNGNVSEGAPGSVVNLTKTGSGTLLFNGPAFSYAATTNITEGTMIVAGSYSTLFGSASISAGATLQIGNGGTTGGFGGGLFTPNTNNGTLAIKRSNMVLQGGGDLPGFPIAGTGGLTQAGTGTTVLTAANTYTGPTTVSAGTLVIASTESIASQSVITVNAGGMLAPNNNSLAGQTSRILSNNLVLNGGAVLAGQDNIGAGGSVTYGSGNIVRHTFTSVGTSTYSLPVSVSADVLVVGGGGGGGAGQFGAGGAGGGAVNIQPGVTLTTGSTIVGAGGAGSLGLNGDNTPIDGNGSFLGSISANGGHHGFNEYAPSDPGGAGGASGNGAAGGSSSSSDFVFISYLGFGGGGGAGAAGGNGVTNSSTAKGGNGGAGIQWNESFYGGGGGGSASGGGSVVTPSFGTGGTGGGGDAAQGAASGGAPIGGNQYAGNGVAGTGGGGGGGGVGGSGGSGVVKFQYAYQANVAAGALNLTGPIDVQFTSTLDARFNGGSISVSGTMSGAGGIQISSSSTAGGAVSYAAAMSYLGDTTILGGATLRAGVANALPSGSGKGNLVLDGGATAGTLDLNNFDIAINALNGTTGSVLGQVVNNGSSATRTLTLGNGNATGSFAGIIRDNTSGTGKIAVTKTGTGTQTLTGAKTSSGGTSVNAGILALANPIAANFAGNILVNAGGTLREDQPNQVIDASSVTLNGGIFDIGSLPGATGSRDYLGSLTMSNSAQVSGTGWILLNGTSPGDITTAGSGNAGTISANITLASQFGTFTGNRTQTFNVITGTTLTVSGAIADTREGSALTGSLTKTGAGTLTLSAVNTYTGGTTVNQGTLKLNAGVFTSGIIHGTATVNSGGTLDIGGNGSSVYPVWATDTINVNGGGVLTVSATGTSWDAPSYVGTVNVDSGSGAAATVSTSGSAGFRFGNFNHGTIASTGATANLWSAPIVLVNGNSKTMTISTGTGNALNLSGAISDYPGLAGTPLTKTGTGTLTLTNANTYTGTTTISAGTLALGAGGSIANSPTIVVGSAGSSGTALNLTAKSSFNLLSGQTLKGIGTVNIGSGKTITVNAGAHWAPGNSIGTNAVNGNLTLSGTSDFELGIAGTTLHSSGTSDRTTVSGTLTLGGSLNLTDNANANSQGSAGAGSYLIFTQSGAAGSSFSSINALGSGASVLHPVVDTSVSGSIYLNVFRQATATAPGTTKALGNGRVGTALTGSNSVTNSASGDGFSESLKATVTGNGTGFTGVAGGASGTVNYSLATPTAGAKSGSASVVLASTGAGTFSDTSLSTTTVNLSGAAYDFAAAKYTGTTLNFGNVHLGATVASQSVAFGNQTVTSASFQDLLNVSATTGNGKVTATGFTGLAASTGGATTNNLTFAANTATAGSLASTATLTLTSNANGVAGLSNGTATVVGGGTITTTGNVYSGLGTWNVNGGGSWGTLASGFGANWDAGGSPGLDASFASSDTATFGSALTTGPASVTLDGALVSLKSITFNNASRSYTIAKGTGSGTLTLNGGGSAATLTDSAGSHGISTNIALATDLTASATNSSDTLTIGGIISGSGRTLTKQGAGTVVLSNANTYTGRTIVSAGTLTVDNDGSTTAGRITGSAAADSITVNSSGTLLLAGTGSADRIDNAAGVTLAGGTLSMAGLSNSEETLGALILSVDSAIDFGTGAGDRLIFGGLTLAGHLLTIYNWSGSRYATGQIDPGTDPTQDRLIFTSNVSAQSLAQINFYSGGTGSSWLGNGNQINFGTPVNSFEVVPVPEPATIFGALALVGLVGWRERRRLGMLCDRLAGTTGR